LDLPQLTSVLPRQVLGVGILFMESPRSLLTNLEELLVREFRTCQSLYELARVERAALGGSDIQQLSTCVERKEALLDDLSRLIERRRAAARNLGAALGLPAHSSSVADIIAALDREKGEQLSRLREGILAVTHKIRDLTRGSLALAQEGLERTERLQVFLLSLHRSPSNYGPGGLPAAPEAISYREIDQAI
jgi:flagellar biosynthesis/type III secretory pathway chaperone